MKYSIVSYRRSHPILALTLTFAMIASVALPQLASARGGRGGNRLPKAISDSDYYDNGAPPQAKINLGNFLFFDKIISGNKNISCATCHHPLADTGDGLSLPVGEGGTGLGVIRDTGDFAGTPIRARVPRNAPHVFNLGAKEFVNIFHDGRITIDSSQPSGFESPAGDDLPVGLDNVLAVQAMFPVTSPEEMAGEPGENDLADFAHAGNLPALWEALAQRLRDEPNYLPLFQAAYPGEITTAADITYVHAANAIAAFEAFAWRADNSAFDQFLRGNRLALNFNEWMGMMKFYGRAGCATCHSGPFQTDHEFKAIAWPQIGPGKGNGPDGLDDFGRELVTADPADRYKFRTPTLRNIELTAPYGHDGAYNELEEAVRHHANAVAALNGYDTTQAVLPPDPDIDHLDFVVQNDPARRAEIAARNELAPTFISDRDLTHIVAFLKALTDRDSIDIRMDVPMEIPSGLPLAEVDDRMRP